MLVWLLVGCFFMLMLLRKALPVGVKTQGREVASVSLTFGERMLMHRMDMYALAGLMLLSAIGQWFPLAIELLVLLVAMGIVNIPMRYHFTSDGFAYNNVVFRRWKEFAYVRVHGSHVTLMPRNGFAPLHLIIRPSRHKEVLPYFQRFLATRCEKPTPWYKQLHMPNWARRRLPALLLSVLLIFAAMAILTACGEGNDPSGTTTANQSNLTGVYTTSSGPTVSQQQLDKGKASEPLAYNLALLVDENRLSINFVWTLVTGYLVMFMQAGFALVETGLCRAKNAGHTMAMNFMVYGLGMIGYYIAGFAFQFGGVGLAGVSNLGGLSELKNELAIPSMMGNGLLAGLVAITAPSGYVSPVFACVIGTVAGVLVIVAAGFVERVLKIDDPVGAIAVHGFNGAWGQLSVGLFADGLANYGGLQVRGIFFGDPGQLVAQIIGMVVCFVYVFGISWVFFTVYNKLFGLRVSAETELKGLDIPEMGSLGYNPDAEYYTPDVPEVAAAGVLTD